MDKTQIISGLQAAHNEYFSLLMKHYPGLVHNHLLADFGPPELCELAVEVQSSAIALGPTALARLNYIGLTVLYPFDNPVDLYNWRSYVQTSRIDHTTYASIAIRVDQELKRLSRVLELGGVASYETLSDQMFVVSKDRYAEFGSKTNAADEASAMGGPAVHIGAVNIGNPVDAPAVGRLEELEKKTAVWSNVSNVVGVLRSLLGS
jgi:hypothetical protein